MRWGMKPLRAALAMVFVALLLVPSSALAAPPPNDAFADRQVLDGDLPITASGSNLEATKEPEEPLLGADGIFARGHTVWYEWKATSSGFVTLNTCGSGMRAVIAVFTGTELNSLTQVAGDFASRGPDCSDFYGQAVTFRATSGTTYSIGIDGSSPFPEEDFPGQGPLELELLETPAPANDDFADAEVLSGKMLDAVYVAGSEGFTWNATKEPGEPAHVGNPGRASVWYSWTAPTTDAYSLQACGRFVQTLLAVYTGSSVSALAPVAADDQSCSQLRFAGIAGTTYRIAVDGKFNAATGGALAGAISVNLYREPPAPPAEGVWPPPYVAPARPETSISRKVIRPRQRTATFRFGSTEAGSRFRCRLDKRPFAGCRSPKAYKRLAPGSHVFRVAAINPTGKPDLSPAVVRFQISRPPQNQR
ncbi:MAG TPA: hypothetical protein VF030_04720 [Solirubrobacterales bacterium]